ncbi:CTP synthase, partial [candidate division WWE3 bacterium]|nr:CTP synthase [candidate division WWE3 bacterium]
MPKQTKYIFVTGGVISGLGKGILTASTGLLLKNHGYKVSVLKADMYLNLDAGTMKPLEHGEVFVTEDGLETDQDLGHYERFLNINLVKHNYLTMGKVYYDVITRDRQLGYSGKCVEGHIHVPEEIVRLIRETGKVDDADVLLIEVGGTVGEYQNIMFYEAIRRLKQMEPDNVFLIHLVYLPIPQFLGEMKSKPAQASIYELYKLGLQPTFVVCRSDKEVDEKRRNTIAVNTGVKLEHIFSDPDVDTIYKIPVVLKDQDYDLKLLKELKLKPLKKPDASWFEYISHIDNAKNSVNIGIAGKYYTSGDFSLQDAYVCVVEAIKHAAWKLGVNPNIQWFDVEDIENAEKFKEIEKKLTECHGIIVPQGWGSRGVEGKLKVVEFARTKRIPYLGLCFGMQMSVIEFARNVLGLTDANSEEVNSKTTNPVIHIMPDQKEYLKSKNYGGTIRLGAWPCKLSQESILYDLYKKFSPHRLTEGCIVQERHRHRYEYNNDYKEKLVNAGLVISGTSPDGKLVESVELKKQVHPYFVGTQFHP